MYGQSLENCDFIYYNPISAIINVWLVSWKIHKQRDKSFGQLIRLPLLKKEYQNPKNMMMETSRDKLFSLLILLIAFVNNVSTHVGLTFPPARRLDLDFLDIVRTKGPCGMPKGMLRTTVMAGSTVNVSWHLAYPHRGGFRIELLDKNEKFMTKLSDPESSNSHVIGNPTAQWHTVTIPDTPCEDCTIRLLREAKEWANYGFWTCGDISIVKASDYKEDCLDRGAPNANAECICDKGFWGPRCQFKDDCDIDIDCGSGKCIDIGGTSLPRKQCFCSAGFHGERCELQNKDVLATPENLELSSHNKTALSDRIQLYHRIVSDASVLRADKEIEFTLVARGTSYVAIGWRPSAIDKGCKSFPAIDDYEGTRTSKESTKQDVDAKSVSEPVRMSSIDAPSPFKLERRPTSYTPRHDFQPMDCSDIVIGTARGMNSRILDYYTRDRSTPRLDTFYGGTSDITSATGWEQDGVTTIIFRRKVKTDDPTDHPLSGSMQVIWARGQEHGEYVHLPQSGLEKENPSKPNFYAQDELKYHGQARQRGVVFINFPE